MIVQYMSDLHLEFPDSKELLPEIPVKSEVLLLCGDICTVFEQKRYYYSKFGRSNEIMKEMCEKHENIELMDKKSLKINGVRFLGCTLWSLLTKDNEMDVFNCLHDFKAITIEDKEEKKVKTITIDDYKRFFETDLKWLISELEKSRERKEKVVVATHHTPLFQKVCPPQYEGSKTTAGFANDMKGFLESWSDVIQYWSCGHTHHNFCHDINGVKVVSNQCGYLIKGEEQKKCHDFDVSKTFTVE